MSNSSLPVEILEFIFQELILDELFPRWYLVPLLRVCKLWHLAGERLLYRTISIGSLYHNVRPGLRNSDKLVRALEGNSQLATLIEKLQISSFTERSIANTQLVNICPNLRHVDFDKINASEIDNLFKVLEDKPLVSFRITSIYGHILLPIFDLMQNLPQIQTITVDGRRSVKLNGRTDPRAPGALNCCPKLREIILDCGCLCEHDFASLRLMCSVVTNLRVRVNSSDTEALDASCGCLHAWPLTLESLSVHLIPESHSSVPPLSQAISSLASLQELAILNFYVDFGTISSLPQLKRLNHLLPRTGAIVAMDCLASHLEDPAKFLTLSDITIYDPHRQIVGNSNLKKACGRRNIKLKRS